MKTLKFPLVFSFVLLTFFNFSQSNTLVVFAQDPTPFYIVLDGVKKNEVAETRVVIPGIRQTNSNVQVYFKDESIFLKGSFLFSKKLYSKSVFYSALLKATPRRAGSVPEEKFKAVGAPRRARKNAEVEIELSKDKKVTMRVIY